MDMEENFEKEDVEQVESLYADAETAVVKPYNPLDVDIISQQIVLRNVFDRLEHNEIILDPDFQRNDQLWSPQKQSRLIESLLIRIPLPTFYFDCAEDETWTVVDGLQRLTALNNFVVRDVDDPKKLRLTGLEYLGKDYDSRSYEELPRMLQRRLQEQTIFAYIIRPGTPEKVKTSIFERINTGGLSLNAAEIRNSVYRGTAAKAVRNMAEMEEFKLATRSKISPARMLDREFTARFAIFYLLGYENYKGNMEDFFAEGMSFLNSKKYDSAEVYKMLEDFKQSMILSRNVFGDSAFRKYLKNVHDKWIFGPINRAVFECVSVCLAKLSDKARLKIERNASVFFEEYKQLFAGNFYSGINNATGTPEHVNIRYTEMNQFITKFMETV